MNFLKVKKIKKDEFIFIKKKTIYTNISIVPKLYTQKSYQGHLLKFKDRVDLNLSILKKKWLKSYLRNLR